MVTTKIDQARVQQLVAMIQANMTGPAKAKPTLHVVRPGDTTDERLLTSEWESYQLAADSLHLPEVDTSPRGIQIRAIKRIMHAYAWGPDAVRFFLDTRGLPYLSDLNEVQLNDLHERMNGYVDATDTGCDCGF